MYTLPTDFLPKPLAAQRPLCQLFPYQSQAATDNAQVFLQTHAISFLQEGEKSVLFPHQQATCQAGQLLMMRRGRCLMTEKTSAAGRYASLLVFFDDGFLGEFFHKYQLDPAPAQDTTGDSYRILSDHPNLDVWAASMRPYLAQPDLLTPELARLKGEEALLHLWQAHGEAAFSFLRSEVEPAGDLALRRTVEGYTHLTPAELAFLCHMSEATFRRHFRRIYRQPPAQWLTARRLAQAAQLLRYEGQSPSEVYLKVGFQSLSSFGQAFKRHFGQTPSAYRSKFPARN